MATFSYFFCRNSCNDVIWGYIFGYNCTSTDNCTFSYMHASQYSSPNTNPNVIINLDRTMISSKIYSIYIMSTCHNIASMTDTNIVSYNNWSKWLQNTSSIDMRTFANGQFPWQSNKTAYINS